MDPPKLLPACIQCALNLLSKQSCGHPFPLRQKEFITIYKWIKHDHSKFMPPRIKRHSFLG